MPRGENLHKVRGTKEELATRFGVEPLERHEAARPLWIRAAKSVLTEFESLPPAERGRLIERALRMRTLYIALANVEVPTGTEVLLAFSIHELHEKARQIGAEVRQIWTRSLP